MSNILKDKSELKEIEQSPRTALFESKIKSNMTTTATNSDRQSRLAGYSRYVIFMKFILP